MFVFYIISCIIGVLSIFASKTLKSIDKELEFLSPFKDYIDSEKFIKIRLLYGNLFKYLGVFGIIVGTLSTLAEFFTSIFSYLRFFDYLHMIILFSCMMVLSFLLLICVFFVFMTVSASTLSKKNKSFVYILLIIVVFRSSFKDILYWSQDVYESNFTKPITLNEEYVLFNCKTRGHKKEACYISINNIKTDENKNLILDISLRYDGRKAMPLIDYSLGFSTLSDFSIYVMDSQNKSNQYSHHFYIADELSKQHITNFNEFSTNINPGDIVNIELPLLIEDFELANLDIKDLKFKIEMEKFSGDHESKGFLKYFTIQE